MKSRVKVDMPKQVAATNLGDDIEQFRLTMYQNDEVVTNELFDKEAMSFDDIARKIRDYDSVHGSCYPLNCESHCWLSSEPELPNYGDGGLSYVDLFVYGLDGRHIVNGATYQALIERSKTV